MFNPLVDNLADLTTNELEKKIAELSKKYFLTGNPQVQSQISAILDMYKSEHMTRMAQEKLKNNQDNDDNSLDNLINIS